MAVTGFRRRKSLDRFSSGQQAGSLCVDYALLLGMTTARTLRCRRQSVRCRLSLRDGQASYNAAKVLRMRSISTLVFTALLGLTAGSLSADNSAPRKERPNVVLIMADDLGYGDLSCYGSNSLKTPALDELAEQGLRLTSFYSGCTICTPSRMALLTGAYPPRLGWRGGVVGYGIKPSNGLAPSAITMAEIFQEGGYRTGLIGKWHLGDTKEHSPMQQGFETAFYIDKSNNQTKKLWRGEKLEADPFDNRRLTELFMTQATEFIRRNRNQPFLLYMPLSAPHFPAQRHPDWKGRSQLGHYGDVVEEMDNRIGHLLESLSEFNLDKNTIVVFLSDNGVEPGQKKYASSSPFRGLKWSTLEGGNRVPCLVRWPGVIPAGSVSPHLTSAIDLFPTLAAACRLPLHDDNLPSVDGVNVLSTWKDPTTTKHPRESLLYWHGWGTLQAIRQGPWKLFVDEVKELPATKDGPVLIKLNDDPEERKDLSQEHPRIVRELLSEASQQLTEIESNSLSLGGPRDAIREKPAPPRWLTGQ